MPRKCCHIILISVLTIGNCLSTISQGSRYTCLDYRRIIEQETHGYLTDGAGSYQENSHCEWLIKAPEKHYITFNVLNLQTECLYDYLLIFDGDSYETGKLLGSLCGNQTGQNFTTSTSTTLCRNNTEFRCEGESNRCQYCEDKEQCFNNPNISCPKSVQICQRNFCSLFKYCDECQSQIGSTCFWCQEKSQCLPKQNSSSTACLITSDSCSNNRLGILVLHYNPLLNANYLAKAVIFDHFNITFQFQPVAGEKSAIGINQLYTIKASTLFTPFSMQSYKSLSENNLTLTVWKLTTLSLWMDTVPVNTTNKPLITLTATNNGEQYFVSSFNNDQISKRQVYLQIEASQLISFKETAPFSGVLIKLNNQVIGGNAAELINPMDADNVCTRFDSCLLCTIQVQCVWNNDQTKCHDRSSVTLSSYANLVLDPEECYQCSNSLNCSNCLKHNCSWLMSEHICVGRNLNLPLQIIDEAKCPTSCFNRATCNSCLRNADDCVWCKTTRTCFPFHLYHALYSYGQCRDWVNALPAAGSKFNANLTSERCSDCSSKTSSACGDCLKSFGCGICNSIGDRSSWTCSEGDFSTESCTNDNSWNYTSCYNTDECSKQSHVCHPNASCLNTDLGFKCLCKSGFAGDGIEICERTCSPDCVRGTCSGYPTYHCLCNLGWTGVDCSIDCQCNGHSFCPDSVGVCKQCYNNTQGPNCDACAFGSYGNASSISGCQLCNCNGHGNESMGVCNSKTGECFCNGDTEGLQCEYCKHNYIGNARNGGTCYASCSGRLLITNIKEIGGITSQASVEASSAETVFCFWILTTAFDASAINTAITPPLELTFVQTEIYCFADSLSVYDGVPEFVTKNMFQLSFETSYLLENLCQTSRNYGRNFSLIANSGVMTVAYNGRSDGSKRFAATYSPVTCPNFCSTTNSRRWCLNGRCECRPEFTGVNCEFDCQAKCDSACGSSVNSNCQPCQYDCSGRLKLPTESVVQIHEVVTNGQQEIDSSLDFYGSAIYDKMSKQIWLLTRSTPYGFTDSILKVSLENGITTNAPYGDDNAPKFSPFRSTTADPEGRGFFVFDGFNGATEFHYFNFSSGKWTKLSVAVSNGDGVANNVPSVIGHSLTVVANRLILIGGYSLDSSFNYNIYSYSISNRNWTVLQTNGLSLPSIYGHTTVYYQKEYSLFVYGGFLFDGKTLALSDKLYIFDLAQSYWTLVPSRKSNAFYVQPIPVSFACSRIVGDYLLVVHPSDETVFLQFPKIQAFNLKDGLWNDIRSSRINFIGFSADGDNNENKILAKRTKFVWHTGVPIEQSKLVLMNSDALFVLEFPLDLCSLIETCETTKNADFLSNTSGECEVRKTCSECLAQFKDNCVWCAEPCTGGFCAASGDRCLSTGPPCTMYKTLLLSDNQMCPENFCLRPDCKTCTSVGNDADYNCAWTKHISKINDLYVNVSDKPVFPWLCVEYDVQYMKQTISTVINPDKCSKLCSTHKSVDDCVKVNEVVNGVETCFWVENLEKCVSSFVLPLLCTNGKCGNVAKRQSRAACSSAKSCQECTKLSKMCGWCGVSGSNGAGFCKEIKANNINGGRNLCDNPYDAGWLPNADLALLQCPAEDECTNGHNDCNEISELCVDLAQGYDCDCKEGYEKNDLKCAPVCKDGCNRGFCFKPNVCQCNFGFTGKTCLSTCNCNGHSDCAGPDDLNTCLQCFNNSMGSHCELCLPTYIQVNTDCLTCSDFCNSHSVRCVNVTEIFYNKETTTATTIRKDIALQSSMLGKSNTVCQNCSHFTTGPRCEQCISGYFRRPNAPKTSDCERCFCNGHGYNNYCDPENGASCLCANNTVTPIQRCTPDNCWKSQCSACKEYFRGNPLDGRQCYREVADGAEDYCLTAGDSGHCLQPETMFLEFNQAAFYVTFPDFANVDIRIIVDITIGEADVFFASDDLFVVKRNDMGLNVVSLTEKMGSANGQLLVHLQQNPEPESYSNWRWLIDQRYCTAYNEFVEYTSKPPVLWLRNVTNRVTILASADQFDLQKTQFYIIVQSKSSPTSGNLIYVQDQPRFELFIFLTVFCSCFVLLISTFLFAWHLKMSRVQNRVQQSQAVEIHQLATRPLAHSSLRFDECFDADYDGDENVSCQPCCLQYLHSGKAAVGTIIIRLPGGKRVPTQLCLGSALLNEHDPEKSEDEETTVEAEAQQQQQSRRKSIHPMFQLFGRGRLSRVRPTERANASSGSSD